MIDFISREAFRLAPYTPGGAASESGIYEIKYK